MTTAIEAGARADLLPCPFCESASVVCCDQGDDDFAVTCKSCGATSTFDDVEANAIAAWNRRPAAIASGELVPASTAHAALADELDGWHDCADGDVSAGNGHFRLQCVSDSDQQRLNLRATLREAAKALRSVASPQPDIQAQVAGAVAEMRERCAKVAEKEAEFWQDAESSSARIAAANIRQLPLPACGDYVVVPRKADWRMMVAARDCDWPHRDIYGDMSDMDKDSAAGDIWTAMLTASTIQGGSE